VLTDIARSYNVSHSTDQQAAIARVGLLDLEAARRGRLLESVNREAKSKSTVPYTIRGTKNSKKQYELCPGHFGWTGTGQVARLVCEPEPGT
jgi:hypothetical protein